MLLTDYPWYFIPLCLLTGAIYAAVLYWREAKWRWVPAVLRFLAVSSIAFLLLAPMAKQTVDERQKPHVVLAQDVSGSVLMSADSTFTLDGLVSDIEGRCRVSYVTFGTAGSTDIGAVLERYRGDDVAALVLASDGLHNRGASPLAQAEKMTFPIHCVALGDTTVRRDAWLAHLRSNRIAMLGGSFTVELTINATLLEGRDARLTIDDAGGRQVFSQNIRYNDADFSTAVSASLTPSKEGLQRYTVQLSVVEGEISSANNRLTFYVDVLDTRRKVLIVGNAPHPDLAALKQAVESNPNYEATVMLAGEVENGKQKVENGEWQLVVLHNLPSRLHPSVSFADGLPCLYIIGTQTDLPRFNALHSGLEINAKVQRNNEVTALHRAPFALFSLDEGDIAALEALPPLTAPFGEARLGADVQSLFTARVGNIDSRQPLVAATPQGDRRRAWVWGEGLWRWRLADWQAHETHSHVDRLVSQLVSFTAMQASRDRLQVQAERSYAEGEPVAMHAVLYNENYEAVNDAEVRLLLTGDSLKADYTFRRDAVGYSLVLPPLGEGLYRYTASADGQTATGSFAVEAVNLEQQRLSADHGLLATMASLTGGNVYRPDQLSDLNSQLSTLKPTIYTTPAMPSS